MSKREKIVFVCLLVFLLLPNFLGVFLARDLQTMGQRAIYMLSSISIYGLGLAAAYVLLCSVRGVAFLGDRAGAPDYQSSDHFVALRVYDYQVGERGVLGVAEHLLANHHRVLRPMGRIFLLESSFY